jgi:hypothetical protein
MGLKFGLSHQGEVRTLTVCENSTEENISTYLLWGEEEAGENCFMGKTELLKASAQLLFEAWPVYYYPAGL